MHNLEKSPDMFSDHLGITSKSLDLVVSPHVLERERKSFLDDVCSLVGGCERDTHYKSSLADPTFLSSSGLSAISWRTVRL